MAQHHYDHLKRLQHSTHAFASRSSLPNDETIRESIQSFTISCNNHLQLSRSFKPAPCRARRGGGRAQGRHWRPSGSLPTRTINYDLAESFMDHSTNPLSSDLYQIRFKHSTKQWPNGRFRNYKEKLEQSVGNLIDVTCTRTIPIVPKRKKIEQKLAVPTSSIVLVDPIAQEQKKKLADKQTNLYANLFGYGKIARLSSTTQTKKTNCISKSTPSNASLRENSED